MPALIEFEYTISGVLYQGHIGYDDDDIIPALASQTVPINDLQLAGATESNVVSGGVLLSYGAYIGSNFRVDGFGGTLTIIGSTTSVDIGWTPTNLIYDDLPVTILSPKVSVTATGGKEGDSNGNFHFTRTGDVSQTLTVNFGINGTATPGTDYNSIGTSVMFLAGHSAIDVPVTITNDTAGEPTETVALTLGSGAYTVGTVSPVTVNIADDDTPTATDDSFSGDEDEDVAGNVLSNDSDPNSNSLTAWLEEGGWFGTVNLNSDGSFTYTPGENFFGTDEFTYSISDGNGGTDTATVTITINAVDDAPVIENQSFTIAENEPDGALVGFAKAVDADPGQTLTYSITAGNSGNVFAINPSTGAITVANPSGLDYAMTPSYSLTVQVSDNGSTPLTSTATISINVTEFAADPLETEGERIEFLNGKYDDAVSLLSQVDPDALTPAAAALGWMQDMIDYAGDMAGAVANGGDDADFKNAKDGYILAMENLMINLFVVFDKAREANDTAFEMAAFSEGDKFRLKGIGSLMDRLQNILAQLETRIIAVGNATTALADALDLAGKSDDVLIDSGLTNCFNTLLNLNKLESDSESYADYVFDENYLDGAPEVIDAAGINDMDGRLDSINEKVNSTVYAAALNKMDELLAKGADMLAQVAPLNIEQFNVEKLRYIDKLNELLGDQDTTFGLMGFVYSKTDETLSLISTGDDQNPGALERQGIIADAKNVASGVDKLRVEGISVAASDVDRQLAQLQGKLLQLQLQQLAIRTAISAVNIVTELFPDENFPLSYVEETNGRYNVALVDELGGRRGSIADFQIELIDPLLDL